MEVCLPARFPAYAQANSYTPIAPRTNCTLYCFAFQPVLHSWGMMPVKSFRNHVPWVYFYYGLITNRFKQANSLHDFTIDSIIETSDTTFRKEQDCEVVEESRNSKTMFQFFYAAPSERQNKQIKKEIKEIPSHLRFRMAPRNNCLKPPVLHIPIIGESQVRSTPPADALHSSLQPTTPYDFPM